MTVQKPTQRSVMQPQNNNSGHEGGYQVRKPRGDRTALAWLNVAFIDKNGSPQTIGGIPIEDTRIPHVQLLNGGQSLLEFLQENNRVELQLRYQSDASGTEDMFGFVAPAKDEQAE